MHYPVAVVWSECRIVRSREAMRLKKEAMVMHTVIATVLAGGTALEELMEKLDDIG